MNRLKGKEQKEDDERTKESTSKLEDSIEKDDSPQKVKSTAVVKYSAVQVPGTFARLQCNTDLNLPPSNWLSSSAESYGLQHVLSHSTGFSSFRMAHMFPDCLAEVDVVSDAENIKKLLKIPYSRDAVSMMVHCVEKTLLIDEFDIHKHLLRTAESDWEWLRKFFYEHVLQSLNTKEKSFPHKNKSRYALQQKSLISKFLHHSLAESESPVEAPAPPEPKTAMTWPPLPEPPVEEELPDPATDHTFNRNVVWTFEDIQMLLGTDMPIFGGSTHPCISLRLRDMTKPISVLTGIDYWLDNLMCNVPEVVMCYHLDGIVQRYELVKTEDLPHMCDSKFSPKIIRDVAQNILSFLKSNATKAGHTYWLFKGKNEDVVKLYDLTCLCSDSLVDKGQNPFTVPVAMLLYRVARNMKHSANNTTTLQPGTIRVLLKNCLNLLPKEKYPQIVTSANYMLSDLYVPVNTDPSCPCLDDEPACNESQEEEEEEELEEEFSNAIKTLCISDFQPKHSSKYTPPPSLAGNLEDRCRQALEHVTAGLQCLQYFETQTFSTENSHQNSRNDADRTDQNEPQVEPKMARPYQAIPMPYAPLGDHNSHSEPELKEKTSKKKSRRKRNDSKSNNNRKNNQNFELGEGDLQNDQFASHCWESDTSPRALLCKQRAVPLPTWQQPEKMDNAAWHAHLKTLLYEKACLVYTTLAERAYAIKKFGRAMSFIKYVLRCHTHMMRASGRQNNIDQAPAKGLVCYLLGRAGDCCIQLAQCWDEVAVHREDFASAAPVDQALETEMAKDMPEDNYPQECKLVPDFITNMEQILHASFNCYQQALSIEPSDNIRRRIGNVHNELGAFYMNQIALGQGPDGEFYDTDQFEILFKVAQQHLDRGQAQFEAASDGPNLALLQSNHGRLMRLLAHYNHPLERKEVSAVEKQYYNKALDYYKKALTVLKNRKSNPLVWDSIMWEMSTTLYTMATLYQDYPPVASDVKSQDDCEREVIELLTKALQSCDLETQSFRQPVYQFRAATLNYRLGSLYHHAYRNLRPDDTRKKSYLHLAQLHYERSNRHMEMLEHPVDFLRMQLERVALQEYVAEHSGSNAKIKALQTALEILIKSRSVIVEIVERQEARHRQNNNSKSREGDVNGQEPNKCTENVEGSNEESNLLALFEKRLQFILRSLCQLCQQYKSVALPRYKDMYSQILKQREGRGSNDHLKIVLTQFEQCLNNSR